MSLLIGGLFVPAGGQRLPKRALTVMGQVKQRVFIQANERTF